MEKSNYHEQGQGTLTWWNRFSAVSIGVPVLLIILFILLRETFFFYFSLSDLLVVLMIIVLLNFVFTKKRMCNSIQLQEDGCEISFGKTTKTCLFADITDVKYYRAPVCLWRFFKVRETRLLEITMADKRQYTFEEEQAGSLSEIADALREVYTISVLKPQMQELLQTERVRLTFGNGLELTTKKGLCYEGGVLPLNRAFCRYNADGWPEIWCNDSYHKPQKIWMQVDPMKFTNTHMLDYVTNRFAAADF